MKRAISSRLCAVWVATCLPTPVSADGDVWRVALDTEATEVRFVLDATLHAVNGTATLLPSELNVFPETGELHGELIVDAGSAETGNARRDRDMHRKVLESERFPRIVLSLSTFEGGLSLKGASRVRVRGELEIHGSRHPVELDVDVSVMGDGIQLMTRFTVPYVEWGMRDPSKLVLRVAKEVRVEVEAAGRISRDPG